MRKEKIQVLITNTARALFNKTRQELLKEGYDVTVEQARILAHLWYKNGQTQNELANCTDRDKTTIARVLNNMEKNNLIIRIADFNDKRINRIYLTNKGKDMQAKMLDIRQRILDKAFALCTEQETEMLVLILKKVLDNI